MFSITARSAKTFEIWNVRLIPSAVRPGSGSRVISRPKRRDRPRARPQRAGDAVEERRLAGAVRADQHAALAGRDVERHAVDRAQAAEILREAADSERGAGHAATVRVRACAPAAGRRSP